LGNENLIRRVTGPLENIKVVDLSRVLAGPWASQLLADYGADVVKLEKPGSGDDTRRWGPPWLQDSDGNNLSDAAYFLAANRNKRSITVNLAHSAGQQVVRKLVADADVLIENFKVGTLKGFSLDYESLSAANPRLIYCSISAYGQTGSKSTEPGYDAMIQASAGLMSLTGEAAAAGGKPQKVGVAIADIMAGMYAATAILAALNAREKNGRGQHIDLALFDSQVAWLANQSMDYLLSGEVPLRYGTAHPNIVPYQAFDTADGSIMIAVGNERQFADFTRCIGCEELAADDDFSSNEKRIENRERLVDRVNQSMRARSTEEWIASLRGENVPAGAIRDLRQVFDDPYASERGLVRHLEHATAGPVPTVANPARFSATPLSDQRAPPTLGEHTREVLEQDLGYSAQEIQSLFDDGAL
jgi:crotonobetainyl-CoA:carnitine CoA-transferase CaiB-like acyl-CoA transferase